jgi:predicted ATPase/class 3 adenylate cyclase
MAELPTGTVTFFFTDIEGSSSRWDDDSATMATSLAVHNSIFDAAIERNGGAVVKTMGDGYMAAFASSLGAIHAAIEAQRELATTDWGRDGEPLLVRIGIHAATVDLVDDDYLGPDVNRAARIEAAGHGGQILVSAAVRELTAASLTDDVGFVDLGRHELRGLSRSEHIYGVTAPGLVRDFPPLRTGEAGLVRNLPGYHTTFVGRQTELLDIEGALAGETRLLTLVGQGGAGKTRLAVEATIRLVPSFTHGAVFCSLASVDDADLAVRALIDALGFSVDTHTSDLPPLDQLLDYLQSRAILIVLDNFEQLSHKTELVDQMLSAGPDVRVLVTSRERLHLSSESIVPVGGLELPSGSKDTTIPSVQLFIERACQIDAGFSYEAHVAGVDQICELVDGLPLGVELAAAWVDILSPDEIAGEIATNLDFLESTYGDRPDRHRSLRAVFESSWNRLDGPQQGILARLSAFVGGFDRDAAQDVAGADLRTMSTLVAKSLVRRPIPGRFGLHPLISQYAAERLAEDSDADRRTHDAHARHYLSRVIEEHPRLESAAQADARDALREDVDNIRSAILWTLDRGEDTTIIDALESIFIFFLAHSWHEGIELLADMAERAAARSEDADYDDELVIAAVQATHAYIIAWLGDLDTALLQAEAAVPVLEARDARAQLMLALTTLGVVHVLRGNHEEGQRVLERAYSVTDRDSQPTMYALLCTVYGWSFYELGDFERAERVFADGYQVADDAGTTLARAYTMSKLGLTADAVGDFQKAIDLHHEGREAFVKLGDPAGEAYTLSRLSWTYWHLNEYERARDYALEALDGFELINHRWGTLATLGRLGFAEIGLGEIDNAARHFQRLASGAAATKMGVMRSYGLIGLGVVASARGADALAAEALAFLDRYEGTPEPYRADLIAGPLAELAERMGPEEFAAAADRGREADLATIERLLNVPST